MLFKSILGKHWSKMSAGEKERGYKKRGSKGIQGGGKDSDMLQLCEGG